MRKDMRLGFGVGGVLLAVIITAILVIHRNQNKQVASLDKTGAITTESTTIGSNDAQPGVVGADESANLKPADPLPVATATPSAKTPEPKIPGVADDSVKSTDATQWDRLFASSTDTTPHGTLRNRKAGSTAAQPAGQPSDSSPQVTEIAPKHDADNAIPASEKITAAKPHATTADSTVAREHVVKPNESFYTIAKAAYGDSKHTKDLQAANPTIEASKLRPGMTLKIPALASLKSTSSDAGKSSKTSHTTHSGSNSISLSATTTTVPTDAKSYTVKSGDSLYAIARRLYGDGSKGDEIYSLNQDVIGNDSTKLKIGQVLKLPVAATVTASAH